MNKWIAMIVTAGLAACGGGGDGGSTGSQQPSTATPGQQPSQPTVTQTNPRAAWLNLLTGTRTLVAQGTGSDNNVYTLTLATAPNGTWTYKGASYSATKFTWRLDRSGTFLGSTSTNFLYEPVGGNVALTVDDDGQCGVVQSSQSPPTTAQLPSLGALYTTKNLVDCSVIGVLADVYTTSVSWSLEQEGTTLFFCINVTESGSPSTPVYTESTCMAVNAAGTLSTPLRIKINDSSSGLQLTARG